MLSLYFRARLPLRWWKTVLVKWWRGARWIPRAKLRGRPLTADITGWMVTADFFIPACARKSLFMQCYPLELKRYLHKTSTGASICAQRCGCCFEGLNIWKRQNPSLAKTWKAPVWRCFRNLCSWSVLFPPGANPPFSISAHVKLEIITTAMITLNLHA